MARTLVETSLVTRSVRKRLEPHKVPYWNRLGPNEKIGYRKNQGVSVWLASIYDPSKTKGSKYIEVALGPADDEPGPGTLSYDDAVVKAREHFAAVRQATEIKAAGPVITVEMAIKDYVAERDARDIKRKGRQVRSDASRRLHRYILGQGKRGKSAAIPPHPIASIALHELRESDLNAWRDGLPKEWKRESMTRTLNDVKAALNSKYEGNREFLPATLPSIFKFGLRAPKADGIDNEGQSVAREGQILVDGDITRLLAAARDVDAEQGWEGDLYRLFLVLNATGARFSQIARMRVRDCQISTRRLMVPTSRKGNKTTTKASHIRVPVEPDVMDKLVPVTVGRRPDEILLQRWRKVQRKGSIEWFRDKRGPWLESSEIDRAWDIIAERAGLPGVVPYCFRHSSIVRFLRKNYNSRVVAGLHDTSTEMIEKHYSAFIVDAFEDAIRAGLVPLVPAEGGAKILKIRG